MTYRFEPSDLNERLRAKAGATQKGAEPESEPKPGGEPQPSSQPPKE